jgi:hypothetical protein
MKKFIYLYFIISVLVILVAISFTCTRKKEILIEESSLIVEDVKEISQLFVISHYSEFTKDTTKNKRRLIIIAKGTIYVGVDLSGFDSTKINITLGENGNKNCELTIPEPKIIDAVINPSGFEIFLDEGGFSLAELQSLKSSAIEKLKEDAERNKIIDKAKKRVSEIFEDYLKNLKFNSYSICFE